MTPVSKLGIYGGTFDPVHHAHLILAREALEQLQLDRVIFVPAAISPHKLDASAAAPPALRLEMLRAAVKASRASKSTISSYDRPPPSFTIDTIEEFTPRASRGATLLPYRLG